VLIIFVQLTISASSVWLW